MSVCVRPSASGVNAADYLGAFLEMFPPRAVQRIPRESGSVQRNRTFDLVAYLHTLEFDADPHSGGPSRHFEGLQRSDREPPPQHWGASRKVPGPNLSTSTVGA